MKATELRIGNYLYYEHTTHIVSVLMENDSLIICRK